MKNLLLAIVFRLLTTAGSCLDCMLRNERASDEHFWMGDTVVV
jgi:hypothetical protein